MNGRTGGVPTRRRKPGLRPKRALIEEATEHSERREAYSSEFEPCSGEGGYFPVGQNWPEMARLPTSGIYRAAKQT